MKITLKFNILIALLVGLSACNTPISDQAKKVTNEGDVNLSIYAKHRLYDGEMTMVLDKKFERFNIAELIEVTKRQPSTSFMNQIFNEQQLQLAENSGENYYVFVDTTNYQNFVHLEQLDKKIPINKEVASMIGGFLKKNLQISHSNSNVDILSAKFGSQPSFSYGYYKMKSTSPIFTAYSNHFAIAAPKSSYILYNIGRDNTDFSELKTKISFQ